MNVQTLDDVGVGKVVGNWGWRAFDGLFEGAFENVDKWGIECWNYRTDRHFLGKVWWDLMFFTL